MPPFGDLHTNLNFTPLLDRNRLLPLGLKWMADGLYVVTAPVGQEAMLGCRLVELNGTAAEVVADSLGTLFSADNEAVRKTMVPNYLCFVQLLEHSDLCRTVASRSSWLLPMAACRNTS